MLKTVVLIIIGWSVCSVSGLDFHKISNSLSSRLQNGEKVNIFIRFEKQSSKIIKGFNNNLNLFSREERIKSIHHVLTNHAERTQKDVREYLEIRSISEDIEFKSFWISNQIYVKSANEALIRQLLTSYGNDIQEIYEDGIVAHISVPFEAKDIARNDALSEEVQWGLRKMQVPEAWRKLGYKETLHQTRMPEIRVATLDTGVRYTHETLRDNFMGDYGWFDPTLGEPHPSDRMGHGTHTTANIAGSKNIGVAPWATWMSCRGCPTLGCSMHDLLACGQFFLCPTLTDGSSPDCSKAPHLISNSWSAGAGGTWYDDVVEAWSAAGIIPVFSIGNFGNAFCGSAFYPGDQENTIGVGSTTIDDDLSWFSSIGQTLNGGSLIKPDVVAPGSDILSAYHTDDDAYELMSGTSMSCPHVAGLIALLLTQNPEITFEEVKRAILLGTEQNLKSRNLTCLGVPDTQYPNYVYGYGRVNALLAISQSNGDNSRRI